MHQELSKDGEDHKLRDVKTTPLDQHTLGLHTSNFCFSINALYRINLERLLFAFLFRFDFLFVLRPPLSFIHERATGNLGWIKLYAIKKLGKRCLSWLKKIHIVAWFMCFLMSINFQVFYQELSFVHVLMLNVTLICLTWIG